jgi:hypothetical protein
MTDQLLPADPFLRPENWPFWMPDTLLGRVPMPNVPPSDVWDRTSSTESQATTPALPAGGLLGSLMRSKDDPSSHGGLFSNLLPSLSAYHLAPVPQAASWDSVPTYPTAGMPQLSPELPSPTSWASHSASTSAAPPVDEGAAAQDARRAAAERLARGARGRATAPDAPPAPEPAAEAGEPGLIERTRLNGVDSFYRGTLMGAGRLALMQHYASTPDEPGIDPQTKRWRDQLRKDYPQVLADLARYDRMRTFGTPAEFAAAAIGQLGGGLPTPESLVGVGAKGGTWLARLLKAGLQQGAMTAATDPAVRALNIRAGVQDEYDPGRTAIAGATGFVTGAGVKSAVEALGRSGQRAAADNEGILDFGRQGRDLFRSPASSFHYTFGKATPSIANEGLIAGSYATPAGNLSPLQAHIDLALPPNRGLPDALIRVDLAGLRHAGYEIPAITQVGRSYGMPGGGYEMRFPYDIPPQFIKIITP